jgi:hypothetical protein
MDAVLVPLFFCPPFFFFPTIKTRTFAAYTIAAV